MTHGSEHEHGAGWLFDRARTLGNRTPGEPHRPSFDLAPDEAIVVDAPAASDFWFTRFDRGARWGDLPTFAPGVSMLFLETAAPPIVQWGDGVALGQARQMQVGM